MGNVLFDLIDDTERHLVRFYDLNHAHSAKDFLLSPGQMKDLPSKPVKSRGNLWILNDQDSKNELFIGITYSDEIVSAIEANNPLLALNNQNIDPYAVIVEEVSHFHLLVNRAEEEAAVSHVELEWQGEIDKFLLAANLLKIQNGDSHLLPLARQLYDLSVIKSDQEETYWQATKYAARFWFDQLQHTSSNINPLYSKDLQMCLQKLYRISWNEKVSRINSRKLPISA